MICVQIYGATWGHSDGKKNEKGEKILLWSENWNIVFTHTSYYFHYKGFVSEPGGTQKH